MVALFRNPQGDIGNCLAFHAVLNGPSPGRRKQKTIRIIESFLLMFHLNLPHDLHSLDWNAIFIKEILHIRTSQGQPSPVGQYSFLILAGFSLN